MHFHTERVVVPGSRLVASSPPSVVTVGHTGRMTTAAVLAGSIKIDDACTEWPRGARDLVRVELSSNKWRRLNGPNARETE